MIVLLNIGYVVIIFSNLIFLFQFYQFYTHLKGPLNLSGLSLKKFFISIYFHFNKMLLFIVPVTYIINNNHKYKYSKIESYLFYPSIRKKIYMFLNSLQKVTIFNRATICNLLLCTLCSKLHSG